MEGAGRRGIGPVGGGDRVGVGVGAAGEHLADQALAIDRLHERLTHMRVAEAGLAMPAKMCLGMMPTRSVSGNEASGARRAKTTWPGPPAATPTWRQTSAPGCWYSRSWRMWKVNSTSSTPKAWPSAHLTPSRMLKV